MTIVKYTLTLSSYYQTQWLSALIGCIFDWLSDVILILKQLHIKVLMMRAIFLKKLSWWRHSLKLFTTANHNLNILLILYAFSLPSKKTSSKQIIWEAFSKAQQTQGSKLTLRNASNFFSMCLASQWKAFFYKYVSQSLIFKNFFVLMVLNMKLLKWPFLLN